MTSFRRPPLVGEHTEEVLGSSLARPWRHGDCWPADPAAHSPHGGPFEGLKVVDFTWAAAGPITTRHFGDLGATVVKIESSKHPDSLRVGPPFVDGKAGINRSGFFAQFNPNKLSICIDMTNPLGRDVARKLILEWADVVVDSFTPRVMPGWGLSYEELSRTRPDLIMLSTCMQGQTGPYRDYAGFGDQGAALSGFFMLNGWPDRDPATPNGAYTDMATPHFGAVALMAALDYRRRTGRGQYIDLSQIECGVHVLAPQVLDYTVRGHVPQRMANRSLRAAPHGVFPVTGDDAGSQSPAKPTLTGSPLRTSSTYQRGLHARAMQRWPIALRIRTNWNSIGGLDPPAGWPDASATPAGGRRAERCGAQNARPFR